VTAEVFAEWLRRRGIPVVRTASSYWHLQGPRAYQAFPYHWVIRPAESELMGLLREHRLAALRYSTPLDSPVGRLSYHAVYEGGEYDLEHLSKWARKNVRRGLRRCSVEPISFERLAKEGHRLQLDTLDRQGRRLDFSEAAWAALCRAAADLPGFEAWGVLVEGALTASVITAQIDDCGYMLYQQCDRNYLADHVNNALAFVVTQAVSGRPGIRSILYSLDSLDAPPSMDEFKFRMGYTAKPVRQRVVFHPWLAPLLNPTSHAAVRRLASWKPNLPGVAKAEGMMRFYLEGRRPLAQQSPPATGHWPDRPPVTAEH
jgi:hypothetical protein